VSAPLSTEPQRPRTRAECVDGPRPCPWVSCRHHLALSPGAGRKAHKLTYHLPEDPADWPDEAPTCALDVAAEGEHTLDAIALHLGGISRERVRQIEEGAKRKLAHYGIVLDLAEDEGIDTDLRQRPRANEATAPPKDPEPRWDYVRFRDEIRDKAAALHAVPPQPIRTLTPTPEVLADLNADLARKALTSPVPMKRPVDFRPTLPPKNQRQPKPTAAAPQSETFPPSPPSTPPAPEPPAPNPQPIPQPKVSPLEPPAPPTPVTPPMSNTTDAIKRAARGAAEGLNAIMAARSLSARDLATLVTARHPKILRHTCECMVSHMCRGKKPTSVYWRRVADALGITLADICPDEAWQAAVNTDDLPPTKPAARTPAPLDTSELDPAALGVFTPPIKRIENRIVNTVRVDDPQPAAPAPEPPRAVEIRLMDSVDDLIAAARNATQRIATLTRERDEALASLAKIRDVLAKIRLGVSA
jgi:hypothetical protein